MATEYISLPNAPSEDTIIDHVAFAKLCARVQQLILVNSEFLPDELSIKFGNANKRSRDIELVLNKIIDDIGLGATLKLLIVRFIGRMIESEAKFYESFGLGIYELLKRYKKADLGYALSIVRSAHGLSESDVEDIITAETNLTADDIHVVTGMLEFQQLMIARKMKGET